MAKGEVIELWGNAVLVECEDTTDWSTTETWMKKLREINDPTEKVQLEEASEETSWLRLRNLFGTWAESGGEDEDLDELYRSRLTPSSMPHDDE